MPRKKDANRGGNGVPRLRENSRLMRAHESVVDLINGRPSQSSFFDLLAPAFFGYDFGFFRPFDAELENDIIYSDSSDDEPYYSNSVAQRPLAPHPRIRQLTQEEADKHAKELLEEEERRKDKAEKNKRKKLRKKEKKRLEKENAVKESLPEEEPDMSTSSQNQGETSIIKSNIEENKSSVPVAAETQSDPVVDGCDSSTGSNETDNAVNLNGEAGGESKVLNLNNSFVSTSTFVEKDPPEPTHITGRKKKKKQLLVVQQPEEEEPEVLKEPEVQEKEENHSIKEKTVEASVDDFAKRSGELASIGNRLAAAGQYEMAVKCFTDAIKYNPKEYKLFGNRSFCYERVQQYESALRDADLALSMEPNWIKGLFRKGKALCGLKRYFEASLTYKEVLRLNSSSTEAALELKRAQTLHLMEMGFTWEQSSEALKAHTTLEEAIEALFSAQGQQSPGDGQARKENTSPVMVQGEVDEEGEWIVMTTGRLRTQPVKESNAGSRTTPKSQSPTPMSRNLGVKPELFPVWVGSLAPTVTYTTLATVFSRAGPVYSIKMLLDHQCAFVHYTRKEDCEKAIQMINGMVVEGAPLAVRYPNKIHTELGVSKSAATDPFFRSIAGPAAGKNIKECFFWRTTGCTKQESCIYRHVPEHKSIDRHKVRL